ncbi:hypothetical protein N7G274_008055 [Stereocaulon virgatum]|uniref:Uncharacterized protein n=1 Tax=Stereocaulon virgatum TaxID=373712 RepID=A0ABR4A0C1_9LECA
MSVIEFDQTFDETFMPDEVLAGLARKAWGEMKTDYDSKPWIVAGISNKNAGQIPTVMAAIVKDKRVCFSSSMRSCTNDRIGYAYNAVLSPPAVQRALFECTLLSANGDMHRTGGNCGEQMAAVITFGDITDGSQDLDGSRVIAWINNKDGGRVIDPCGDVPGDNGLIRANAGCKTFITALKLTAVPETVRPRDLDANVHFVTDRPSLSLSPAHSRWRT